MDTTEYISNQSNLKEQFWNEHIKLKRNCPLSKAAYCCNNKLNYKQFYYWKQKLKLECQSSELLPIKLISTVSDNSGVQHSILVLCTLTFKSGNVLSVYDQSVIPSIKLSFLRHNFELTTFPFHY